MRAKIILLFILCTISFTNVNAQEPMLGEIRMFAGNFPPRGWAFCDGQLLSISQNSALFSLIGCTYGGDCRTTFALPDLRGRVAMSAGNGPGLSSRVWGQKGGGEYNILNQTQLPSHTHTATGTVKAANIEGTTNNPTGNVLALAKTAIDRSNVVDSNIYAPAAGNTNMSANGVTVTVGNTGGNQSVNNMQPYLVVRYIIALQGYFPSRN